MRVGVREARAEAAGHSDSVTLPQLCSHLPDTNTAGQLLSAPVLCRGTGALAAQELLHALEPPALRAEALQGGTGGQGAAHRRDLHCRGSQGLFSLLLPITIPGLVSSHF